MNVLMRLLISSSSALCLALSHRHAYTHTHPLSIANPKDSVLFSSSLNGPPSCDPLFPRPSPASWWGVVFNPLIKYHRGGCNPVRASGSSTHISIHTHTRVQKHGQQQDIIAVHLVSFTRTYRHMHTQQHHHQPPCAL